MDARPRKSYAQRMHEWEGRFLARDGAPKFKSPLQVNVVFLSYRATSRLRNGHLSDDTISIARRKNVAACTACSRAILKSFPVMAYPAVFRFLSTGISHPIN